MEEEKPGMQSQGSISVPQGDVSPLLNFPFGRGSHMEVHTISPKKAHQHVRNLPIVYFIPLPLPIRVRVIGPTSPSFLTSA